MLLMCAFVGFQRGPTLGVLQASTAPKAAVFRVAAVAYHVSNLAAVFHVSKPCSSLSGISKPCRHAAA